MLLMMTTITVTTTTTTIMMMTTMLMTGLMLSNNRTGIWYQYQPLLWKQTDMECQIGRLRPSAQQHWVDYGIISLEDQINIVDPHKVWRARLQLRRAIRATAINNEEEITAIFFDGRKDMTLMREKRGDKWYSTKKNEEHNDW